MKYLRITCVFILLACLIAVGQVNQIWYKKGKVLYAVPVAGIDSVTYGQFLSADTFFIVIDRASRRIVYDTIDVHVPGMVFHDTIHTTHTVHLNPGRRIGVFSVAKDRQVSFSQGNLQYIQNQNIWKFADQQYEYIGVGNVKDGKLANKIDLFGWSGDNTTAPFGVSTSIDAADYAGDFVDWGMNEINGEAPNTWRTLSKDEWEYLINKRDNASQLYGAACVNGVNGVMFMPDDWVSPDGVIFVSGMASKKGSEYYKTQNNYSLDQWAVLENSGVVFLPAAGRRTIDPVNVNEYGNYWSSSIKDNQHSHYLAYYSDQIYVNAFEESYKGRAVRLVHDTIVPPPAPCMVVRVNDTLSINMMCVEGGTFVMGAKEGDAQANANEKPAHQVTLSDYYMSDVQVSQALWEVVMGTTIDDEVERHGGQKNIGKGADYPMYAIDWFQANEFAEKLSKLTGLRFSLPTEAEWEYAARGGQKSRGYKFAGSDNLDEVAWWNDAKGLVHPSGQLKPNELGIYDMCGNICEWTLDGYSNYTSELQINPLVPRVNNVVQRSMSSHAQWKEADHRVTFRYKKDPNVARTRVGMRLVLHDTVQVVPEYVDLGLSVKWATFNVGAMAPEEYGNYFAWGEVEPKAEYSWENYKWGDGTASNMTKYNEKDGLTSLKLEDDAAHVNWGGKWRMPTDAEFTELREKCKWEWTTQNGVNGYKVIGVNGNSIFLPVSGFYYDNGLVYVNDHGDYWSSTKNVQSGALHVYTDQDKILKSSSHRYYGFPIRAVYDDNMVIFTINCTPEDAEVGFHYSGGHHVHGNSVMVKKGASPLYQVAATKEGYLSQGDTLHNLTKDTTLNITLKPFSEGTWVKIDNSEFTKVESYFVSRKNGYFSGPHSNWNYFYAPVVPGETYRVCANAGQLAAIWYAASNAPNQEDSIRPKMVACSENGGITRYIAEEFTIPEGATYLIINHAGADKNLVIERKVPDPCQVVRVNDTLSINMMCVERGTFMMGASDDDLKAQRDEKPQHQVTITYDYKVMQTEVTQGLWEAVMGEDIYDLIAESPYPSSKPISTKANFPVGYVRLYQCLEFIDSLNARTGLHFRMPTEAEWEFAARGGNNSKGYLYSGSDDPTEVANRSGQFKPVASLKPNELGIYDMSGNIAEMVLDGSLGERAPYTSAEPQIDPRLIRQTGNRMVRNSRPYNYDSVRVTQRSAYTPSWCGPWMGFRLVLPEERDFRTIYVNGVYFDMAFVEGGTFMMGDDSSDNASPAHQVTLSDYYIGQTEVTQALWEVVMGTNPSKFRGNNLPVECVSWEDCQLFVQKLSEMTGLHFRLPTEAEWEYAARGGVKSRGYKYVGSDDVDSVAWYGVNSGQKTHSIAGKKPNELGIYDMSGNVWEWCQDWHEPYSAESQENPQGASEGEKPVIRGGCWHYNPIQCTPAYRYSYYNRIGSGSSTGFRIVLDIK